MADEKYGYLKLHAKTKLRSQQSYLMKYVKILEMNSLRIFVSNNATRKVAIEQQAQYILNIQGYIR